MGSSGGSAARLYLRTTIGLRHSAAQKSRSASRAAFRTRSNRRLTTRTRLIRGRSARYVPESMPLGMRSIPAVSLPCRMRPDRWWLGEIMRLAHATTRCHSGARSWCISLNRCGLNRAVRSMRGDHVGQTGVPLQDQGRNAVRKDEVRVIDIVWVPAGQPQRQWDGCAEVGGQLRWRAHRSGEPQARHPVDHRPVHRLEPG